MANIKAVEWQGRIYNITDNVARGEAETAHALAQTAQTSANTAQTTADNAQASANTAQSTATTAHALAQTAQTSATTAQSTANTAHALAQTAQTSANTAQNEITTLSNMFFRGTAKSVRDNFFVKANASYSFTMPENGIVYVYFLRKITGYSLFMKRNGEPVSVVGNYSTVPISGTMIGFFKKGDVVNISTDAPVADEGFLILRAEMCY